MRRGFIVVLTAIGLCLPVAGANAGEGQLEVTGAWSRATVGSSAPGVVYLTIENHSPQADRLLSLSTPIARHASLHQTIREGGMMHMRSVEQLEIPPGSSVSFEPGGLHVMLMGLRSSIEAGDHFPLTIRFEKRGAVEVDVAAGTVGALAPEHRHAVHSTR